ncbi:hypothetical protein QCA50_014058 [Cerrena zonata]|uniref:NADP-dependent oxidoreductase domain-containing protein n=1 Tax=Cerrena zonata TaxID=2478898 RepID=A0AAW0G0W6_9APHY
MSSSFVTFPPPPPTKLGRHRVLSTTAGVHVSPICLGAMSIGDQWEKVGMGSMDKESSFKLLDAFYDAGGNFIDTANAYQCQTSEMFIGEWMERRNIRHEIVIATKYTTNLKWGIAQAGHQNGTHTGNSIKSMFVSVESSLKNLRTNYIDILYVHWWDFVTSIEEVMNGLHNLVVQGKVLYLGISDTPAWVVSRANTYARAYGKTPFVVYQGAWNVLQRDLEREIIPMVKAEGMAIAPYNVLAGGKIRSDAEEERRRQTGEKGRTIISDNWERTPDERKVCLALEKVAQEVGAKSITAVAIAYVMQKVPYVFPIVGGRKIEHLHQNIEALDISLTKEQIKYIEDVKPFDLGFPCNFFGNGTEYNMMFKMGGAFDRWPEAEAIRPSKV